MNISKGLSKTEVDERIREGKVNFDETPKTKTVKEIIRDNFFNYFNFLNLVLGGIIIIASLIGGNLLNGLKNCLFMLIIIENSVISLVEELISKKIIDKLSVIGEAKAKVIRDGIEEEIDVHSLVLDDIVKLELGHQIVADTKVLEGEIEVNESLITGESNAIVKRKGDELLSGSFIVSGSAYGKIIRVGKDSYASKITSEAKYKKDPNSIVMGSFTKVLKFLSILIIPIGILMFIKEVKVTGGYIDSVLTTVASLIGMIPEGLILLSSSVMAVGVIKLYRVKVLVQQLYSVETLARVDTICLDKTGTLTTGEMKVVDIKPYSNIDKSDMDYLLKRYVNASKDNNDTMRALKASYGDNQTNYKKAIPFSSERKFSAIEFDDCSLYLGAPDILTKDKIDIDNKDEYRILALCKSSSSITSNPSGLELVGYILVEDVIRDSAKETLEYFKNNDVTVKLISGDNINTVLNIAKKVGLKDINGININNLNEEEVREIINTYDSFGRVKPEQKKWIIKALKDEGHIVAMTGDGVNDVLALKESDCAISVKSGTEAARNVSQLILLNNDFNSLPRVVEEGRQIINNIERSASLLLMKTLYTIMLIIFSILSLQKYFFIPIQLTFISFITIGAPSFFLALERNKGLVKGNFILRILSRALPISMTVLVNIILISSFASLFNLSYSMQSSISVILTAITGLVYLYKICSPLNKYRGTLFGLMLTIFLVVIIFFSEFFNIEEISKTSALITFVLTLDTIYIYQWFNYLITKIFNKFDDSIEVESKIAGLY